MLWVSGAALQWLWVSLSIAPPPSSCSPCPRRGGVCCVCQHRPARRCPQGGGGVHLGPAAAHCDRSPRNGGGRAGTLPPCVFDCIGHFREWGHSVNGHCACVSLCSSTTATEPSVRPSTPFPRHVSCQTPRHMPGNVQCPLVGCTLVDSERVWSCEGWHRPQHPWPFTGTRCRLRWTLRHPCLARYSITIYTSRAARAAACPYRECLVATTD